MTPTKRQRRRGWEHSGSDPPDKPRRKEPMVHSFSGYIVVFLGAGLGGALRHGVNVAALRLLGSGFPYGTLTVNIRSEEHTSELQSLMRISYAVFCLKKKT